MNAATVKTTIYTFVTAVVLFASPPAINNLSAQQEADVGVEEIIVTARRREESLQDIPISITAFTAEDIARRNIQEMEDVARFTPGLHFEDFGGSGYATPIIRGATQQAGSFERNVSSFFDGIYLPRNYVTDLGFANIERIEVVKGPQSARYGRNAFMGAINYIPQRPTDELEINVSVTAGDEERLDGNFAISGPLGDSVRFRISADHSEFDGTWPNTHEFSDISFQPGSDSMLGGWERDVLHAALEFDPSENVTISLSYYDYEVDDEHDPQNWFGELNADSQIMNCGQYNPDVRPAGAGGFGFGGDWFRLYCGELPIRNVPLDPRGYSKQMEGEFLRASVNWTINDNWDLEYMYGRIEADSFALGFKDTAPPACTFFILGLCVFENGPIGNFETDSHEIRVSWDGGGSVSASFGVYYTESEDFGSSNFSALLPLAAVPTGPVDVLDPDQFIVWVALRNTVTTTEAWSPFAEVNWSFAEDRARLGVEARYSSEDKLEGALASGCGEGVFCFSGKVLSDTFTAFTPRVTLEYDLTDDNMLFGSVAQGIKTGGFNGTATLAKNDRFDQDENTTFEIGSRNTFADGNVQLNATLFYITWSDLQIRAQDEGNPSPLPVTITSNVGDVTSYGIEMDAAFAANENLTLYGTLYLGDSTFDDGTIDNNWARRPSVCDDVVCPINGDLSGNTLNNQPDTQASIGFDWQHQLGIGDLDYYIRADLSYQSKIYADSMNLATLPDRTLVNASFGFLNDRYSVQFWARNLTDEEYISSARMQSPNLAWNAYLGERRTFGVTANVNWRPN